MDDGDVVPVIILWLSANRRKPKNSLEFEKIGDIMLVHRSFSGGGFAKLRGVATMKIKTKNILTLFIRKEP